MPLYASFLKSPLVPEGQRPQVNEVAFSQQGPASQSIPGERGPMVSVSPPQVKLQAGALLG